jgi:hypothetical protein
MSLLGSGPEAAPAAQDRAQPVCAAAPPANPGCVKICADCPATPGPECLPAALQPPRTWDDPALRPNGNRHGLISRHPQHGAVLRLRERRARRARRQVRKVRHQARAGAPAAQGQHRGQEGLLRLGRATRSSRRRCTRLQLRTDRNSPCAPVRQELGRHPHGGGCAGPLLHQEPRRHLRHHQRRLRLLAAGLQAARERQAGDRRRREGGHLATC